MQGDIGENAGQRAEAQRVVTWNGDVMLAAPKCRQSHMTPFAESLRNRVARAPSTGRLPKGCEAASYRQHFLPHKVQPNQLGRFTFLEVAANGIPHLLV
jgi:hypothetical protein